MSTVTLCPAPSPKKSTASKIPRSPFIDFSDKRVRSSVRRWQLILKSHSTSLLPCDLISIFLTSLDNVGYFGYPSHWTIESTEELTEMKQSADGFIKHYRISKQLANKLTQELEAFLECIQAGMSSS
ncbi:unnamed protein product [Rotaria magnacalcarata]